MVFKTLLIIVIFAILMEDSTSTRKTEEERKEDEEVAKAVNRTLAEEEKKRKEEEDEAKKKEEGAKEKEDKGSSVKVGEDEASSNHTSGCPVFRPCAPCGPFPEEKPCQECPKEKLCPEEKGCPEEKPCLPCRPCGPCPPCPVGNSTVEPPSTSECPEPSSMTVPVAMAIGACASLLVTGVATALGLLLRYVPPTVSGFLILATIIIIWYLCSHYPETAREIGGRAANLLREAAVALGHRVTEAIRRHQEQVGVPTEPNLFFRMSSMFQKVCTKIFYVTEN
jgi:hypothetical protein